MNDREIDGILASARVSENPAPETLQRIAASVQASLRPVRPLTSLWLLTAGLVFLCSAFAVAAAAHAGFDGIEKMASWQRALIFATLTALTILFANQFARSMTPGRRLLVSTASLFATGILALLAAFAISFPDHHVDHFVSAGVACLITGLLHALPAGLFLWLLLRRGFAIRPVTAGWIAGALAGLAGVGVLELHCVNFQAAHVLLWHTAVIPTAAALGAICAAMYHRLSRWARPRP
jgi:hypothetical protein